MESVCRQAFAAWIGFLGCFLYCVTHAYAMTTEATSSEENKSIEDDEPRWIKKFPQSALSLFGLATFIILSMVIAAAMEKLYERMSIRDDSSDMSEGTKNILRARVLGLMFGKTDKEFNKLTGEAREKALAKKYWEKWHYQMIMRKQRKKKASMADIKAQRRGSFFSDFKKRVSLAFNRRNVIDEEQEPSTPEKAPPTPTLEKIAKPASNTTPIKSVPTPKSKQNGVFKSGPMSPPPNNTNQAPRVATKPAPGSPAKLCRSPTKSEFVTVDLKHLTTESSGDTHIDNNIDIYTANRAVVPNKVKPLPASYGHKVAVDMNKSFEDDEFAIDMNPLPTNRSTGSTVTVNKTRTASKLSKNDTESDIVSQKYLRTDSPRTEPIAKKSKMLRPLTAGRSRQIAPGGVHTDPRKKTVPTESPKR